MATEQQTVPPISIWAGVTDFEYDARTNMTHGFVACASFREWWSLTGRIDTRGEFLAIIESAVVARLDYAGLLDEIR